MAPLNLYLNLRLITFNFRFKKLIKVVNTLPTKISPTLYTNSANLLTDLSRYNTLLPLLDSISCS